MCVTLFLEYINSPQSQSILTYLIRRLKSLNVDLMHFADVSIITPNSYLPLMENPPPETETSLNLELEKLFVVTMLTGQRHLAIHDT